MGSSFIGSRDPPPALVSANKSRDFDGEEREVFRKPCITKIEFRNTLSVDKSIFIVYYYL